MGLNSKWAHIIYLELNEIFERSRPLIHKFPLKPASSPILSILLIASLQPIEDEEDEEVKARERAKRRWEWWISWGCSSIRSPSSPPLALSPVSVLHKTLIFLLSPEFGFWTDLVWFLNFRSIHDFWDCELIF